MSTLSDELNNDPEGLGYATPLAAGNHEEVARILNEPRYDTVHKREISSRELLVWGGQQGRLASLKNAAENHADGSIKSVADAAILMIEREDTSLKLDKAEIMNMVDALVTAGVFSSSDKASLETLSTKKISRAEQLGLDTVTHQEVANATT